MAELREDDGGRSGGLIRAPQDFAAGVFLLLLAALAYWGTAKLDLGTLRSIGPGMLPRATAVIVAGFGVLLIVGSFLSAGQGLERWRLREPFFVLGAALLFAWTVRPLGLIIAGPLALLFASLADRSTRLIEVVIFAVVMTGFCILLFSYLLGLPIPIRPTQLPYPIDQLMGR